jgi:hypothetical protein
LRVNRSPQQIDETTGHSDVRFTFTGVNGTTLLLLLTSTEASGYIRTHDVADRVFQLRLHEVDTDKQVVFLRNQGQVDIVEVLITDVQLSGASQTGVKS